MVVAFKVTSGKGELKIKKLFEKRRLLSKKRTLIRMELQNFPLDIQELSITVASKYSPKKVHLISDPNRISILHGEAINTFRDQQKWKVRERAKIF